MQPAVSSSDLVWLSWLWFPTAGLDVGDLQDGQQQLEGILNVRGAIAAL